MKHLRLKTFRHLAFTFTELMVTLMIVGILMAVAVVSYGFYKNKIRLAEASTILNTFATSEITYYAVNKEFMPFYAPIKSNGLNYYQASGNPVPLLPNNGEMYTIDSSDASYLDGMAGPSKINGWNALGKPLSDGTGVSFIYAGGAGKSNSSGQIVGSSNNDAGILKTSQFNPLFYNGNYRATLVGYIRVNSTDTAMTGCSTIDPSTGQGMQDASSPGYSSNFSGSDSTTLVDRSWVWIGAAANFDNSTNDVGGSGNQRLCSFVLKYIETTAKGTPSVKVSLANYNIGH